MKKSKMLHQFPLVFLIHAKYMSKIPSSWVGSASLAYTLAASCQ